MKRYILVFILFCCSYLYSFNYVDTFAKETTLSAIWQQPVIKIYVENNNYKSLLQCSFEEWLKNITKPINIEFVNNISEADIKFFINDDNSFLNKKGSGFLSARTKLLKKNNKIYNADVYIQTINPVTKKIYNRNELYAIILHETGHSLGILHHSLNTNDVMYDCTNIKKTTLSNNDINSLKCIYLGKNCNTPNNKNYKIRLKEAKRNVSDFPNKSAFLINLGNLYKENKELDKALKCYEKALNTNDEEFYKAYYYIGIINTLQKKYQEAYSNFEKLLIYEPDNFIYIEGFSKIKEKIADEKNE